ncbi:MAG TPA: hypothetical protein VII75_02970 [Thermoanaerobaculia bacterium]|nr:hypothetical protein [Thermoanaerobaculia bacterium]
MKKLVVAAAMMLVAGSAFASNFRAADQVYVPVAGHLAGGSGTFISDVFISNVSTDPVTVTVIYVPFGAGPSTPQNNFPPINLAAGERKEFIDFFASALGLPTGFGQLIFNGCKQGSDCGPATQDSFGVSPFFRPITVESRIFSIPTGTTLSQNPPTNGQDMPGMPWYSFVSSDSATVGLDKVFVTGLRNTGAVNQAGTYRGNLGLINASQFSNTTLAVKLFNGSTGQQIGTTVTQGLAPLGNVQLQLGGSFPAFTGATATNAYVTVEQISSTPTSDSPQTCGTSGCPAFFVYGSVLDNQSGDATTLEAQFLKPLTDAAIACIFNPTSSCKATTGFRRAVKH